MIDAQLPARLARLFESFGHDAVHSSEMPDGNRSSDAAIKTMADTEDRVVVTKDRDFRDDHLLQGTPRRLLIVETGNISNIDLLSLFETNRDAIISALEEARFVEIGPGGLIIHDDRLAD